ncbi:MAG: FtsX-like permease family protein [Acidobacteriota bacterium]
MAVLPPPLLRRSALRHLRRRPWLAGLTVAGVALAVAVVVGINLANESAERAFRLSVDDVAGRATHQVVGGPTGIDEAVYAELRLSGAPGVRQSAPVVEGRGAVLDARGREVSVSVLGVDPWAERPVRQATADLVAEDDAFEAFLTKRGAVALARPLADKLGASVGAVLDFTPRGRDTDAGPKTLYVVAILEPQDERESRAFSELLIADIAAAQEILGRPGRIDRIDLALTDETEPQVAAVLPPSVELRRSEARSAALEEMTRAFRLNLTALSMLALLVGMFLIYNAMTFLVVERRQLLGRFRAMGVTRRQILTMVLFEAATLGAVGSVLGLALGQAMARGLLALITQTINDLYFVLSVRDVAPPFESLLLGAALGTGGAMLAALRPALEAAGIKPQMALRRSSVEAAGRRQAPRLALLGLLLGGVAAALVAIPGRSLALGFASVFIATLAFAAVVPFATLVGSRLIARPAGALFGSLGRMAARDVGASLSRTGVAVAALSIAVATTIGVAIMVSSFRATLVDWLGVTLQADLYASPVSQDNRGAGPPLDPEILQILVDFPAVMHVATYRRVEVASSRGPTQLHALGADRRSFQVFSFTEGDRDAIFTRFSRGDGVLVSEPYAFRHGVGIGDSLELRTEDGPRDFEILAVFYDYASDRGLVMMDSDRYGELWRDSSVQSVGLYLEPDADPDLVIQTLRRQVPEDDVRLVANAELRRLSLEIFDRTFRITEVLRLLAVAVAFFGVFSALMALQLERGREIATLRAMGLVPRQVRRLLGAQNALLGALAGVLAAPLGVIMASMLIYVINKRSFGWTLHLTIEPSALLQGLGLAVAASLLAGWLPARHMAARRPAGALREE